MPPLSRTPCVVAFCSLALMATTLRADTFHVAVDGADAEQRDGRTAGTAWESLAYACRRVPGGEHTIQLGSGTFVASETSFLKSGWTIAGRGRRGENATKIIASRDWKLSRSPNEGDSVDEFLIVLKKVKNVTIRDLELASPADHRITGAVLARGCEQITIENINAHDFRWSGLQLEHSRDLDIHHCRIENASTEKFRHHGGLIRTRWIKSSQLHHLHIVSDVGGGYGYKGAGHEDVRIHHNYIDVAGGFAIESAHENEFGVEIDHNFCSRCISIPKGGQGADPNERGFKHSFDIHHNLLTDSYSVEGPRNHLRFHHNYIRIERPNGRVYTHHGGINHGPIWIHHNVVENVDRAFVWMNNGLAENLHIYNNTVFCNDAGERTDAVFGAYTGERLNNWIVKNNIIVAPDGKPRKLHPNQRGVGDKIIVTNNVLINITEVPKANQIDIELPLRQDGDKPWPYFAPLPKSSLINGGIDVGLPFNGKAPNIGAFEVGESDMLEGIPTSDDD